MKIYISSLLLLIAITTAQAQCVLDVVPSQDTISCGDSVIMNLSGFSEVLLADTFSFGGVTDPCWSQSQGAIFTNPYIPSNSGGAYFWMGTTNVQEAELQTCDYNLMNGGQICFEFAYAVQGQPAPIEGPDQYNEGISVQYSTDGGATWVDVVYYAPNGDTLVSNPGTTTPGIGANGGAFESWTNVCITLPLGAQTSSTRLRIVQLEAQSSGPDYDHWGVDDVQIYAAGLDYGFFNEFGDYLPTNTPVVYPTSDSSFTYLFTNAIDDTCYASTSISLEKTNAGPDLIVCEGIGAELSVTGVAPWSTVSWTPAASLDDATNPNPFATPLTDTEYIITSDCGVDSVFVEVEESFDINIATPDSICINGTTALNLSTTPSSVGISQIEWNNANSLSDSVGSLVYASPYVTTNYVATVTSDSGCVIQDSAIVFVQGVASQIAITPSSPSVCLGSSVDLTASPAAPSDSYTLVQTTFNTYPTTGGTAFTGLTDDNTQGPLTFSFNFPFFGNSYNQMYLSSNGWLTFTAPAGSSAAPQTIPNPTTPNNLIAWAWDDLTFNNGGTLNYYEGGTAPNRYLVLNFSGVTYWLGTDPIDVQVVIHENGMIEINNINLPSNGTFGNVTQGIENATGTEGVANTLYNNANFSSVQESWTYIPYTAPVNPTYTWSPSDFLNTTNGANVTSSTDGTIEYTVTMEDGLCSSVAFVTVDVDTIQIDSITNDIGLTCPESNLQLYVDASTTVENAPQDSIYQIGHGTQSSTTATPYKGLWHDGRIQIIYSAADLLAEGFVPGSNINGIAFNIINKGSSIPYSGFNIGVQHTSLNVLTSFIGTGFTNVFGPSTVTSTTGWNWHNFTNTFQWDGTSNLLFQICFDNNAWTSNDAVEYTQTTTNTVAYDYADFDIGCNLNFPSFSNYRPNLRIRTDYVPGGFAPISYQWTSNPVYTFNDDTIFNPIITDEVNQVTEVYVDATDGKCSVVDTVLIDFSGSLTLTPDTVICQGDSVQLTATGGTNATWVASSTLSSTSIPNPIAFPSTTTTYEVSVDLANCSVTGVVEVGVSEVNPPVINGGVAQVGTCLDQPVDLTSDANPTFTNTWTGPETGTGENLTVNTSGIYTLTTVNNDACEAESSIEVNIANPGKLITDSIRNILCCNDAVTIIFNNLNSSGADIAEIYWDGSTSPATGPITLFSDDDGVYDIRTIDVNGCEAITQFVLETKCNDVEIQDEASIVAGQTHDYSVITSVGYDEEVWYPSNLFTNNTFSSNNSGENLVYVNIFNNFVLNNGDDYSCIVSDSSSIDVINISNPEMPDAFSPNGDGLNDTFFPVNLDPNSSIQEFVVYNRWGVEVYRYNNDNGWDGTWNGVSQPVDTYTYYINIDKTTENYIHSGTITLIK